MLRAALVALLLSGCTAFPVAIGAHGSDPSRGEPFNSSCDPTFDFAGGGVGLERGNNRAYIALGQKLVRQCALPGAPHVDDRSLGGLAIYIHEFRR